MQKSTEELLQKIDKSRNGQIKQKDQLVSYLSTGILFVSATLVFQLDIALGLYPVFLIILSWTLILISLLLHLGSYHAAIKHMHWLEEQVKIIDMRAEHSSLDDTQFDEAVVRFESGDREKYREVMKFNDFAFYALVAGLVLITCFATYILIEKFI